MANYIPFEKLEVGKTYYMQSHYWHKVLWRAKILEINLFSGHGKVETSWNPNSETGHGWCMIRADEDWMWDEMPSEEEQRKRIEQSWHESYVPPRMYEGVMYYGKGIPNDWGKKLDELATKLMKTITYDQRFKMNRDGTGCFIWESKLNYNISEALIRGNGECDWDSIAYLKQKGFDIHAGERDSCGWLTGVIEWPGLPFNKKILYG